MSGGKMGRVQGKMGTPEGVTLTAPLWFPSYLGWPHQEKLQVHRSGPIMYASCRAQGQVCRIKNSGGDEE